MESVLVSAQVGDVFLWPLDSEYLDNVGSGLFESSLMTFMACQPWCLPKGNDVVHGKSPLGTACWPTLLAMRWLEVAVL